MKCLNRSNRGLVKASIDMLLQTQERPPRNTRLSHIAPAEAGTTQKTDKQTDVKTDRQVDSHTTEKLSIVIKLAYTCDTEMKKEAFAIKNMTYWMLEHSIFSARLVPHHCIIWLIFYTCTNLF